MQYMGTLLKRRSLAFGGGSTCETGQAGRSNPKYTAEVDLHYAYKNLCSEDTGLSGHANQLTYSHYAIRVSAAYAGFA